MIPKIERDIWKPVITYARKKLGLHCTKLDVRHAAGIPDFIIWMPAGKVLLIEFKKPNGKPTPLQVEAHKWLRKLGYEVHTVDNIEQGKELLRRTLAERTKARRVETVVVPDKVHEEAARSSVRSRMARPRSR